MITINDNDLPITVAEKIITGTKPYNPTPLMKAIGTALTGEDTAADTVDMFDLGEIKEIADYLMTYYANHPVSWSDFRGTEECKREDKKIQNNY